MLKSDDHVNPNSYQTNFMYSAGIFDVYSIAFYIFILISFVQPGSHCILKWGGGGTFGLIPYFVPSMYSSTCI